MKIISHLSLSTIISVKDKVFWFVYKLVTYPTFSCLNFQLLVRPTWFRSEKNPIVISDNKLGLFDRIAA